MKGHHTRTPRNLATHAGAAWLDVDGLNRVRAHVWISGLDPVADVARAITRQYGRTEAMELLVSLHTEAARQPEIREYVEALISAL